MLIGQATVAVTDDGRLLTSAGGKVQSWVPDGPRGHFRSVGVALVVETQQVQHTVHRHMRPMRFQGFTLEQRLPSHDRGANH